MIVANIAHVFIHGSSRCSGRRKSLKAVPGIRLCNETPPKIQMTERQAWPDCQNLPLGKFSLELTRSLSKIIQGIAPFVLESGPLRGSSHSLSRIINMSPLAAAPECITNQRIRAIPESVPTCARSSSPVE